MKKGMKSPLLSLLALLTVLITLVSCESTEPTAADMDRYHKQVEVQTQSQIAELSARRSRGELSQEQYDDQVAALKADIPRRANEIAWTRHDLVESQKRALGIPTGDHPVQVDPPMQGGQTFYRQAGQVSQGFGNQSLSPQSDASFRGFTPGIMASQAAQRTQNGLSAGGY
jgi:hypothetical protein